MIVTVRTLAAHPTASGTKEFGDEYQLEKVYADILRLVGAVEIVDNDEREPRFTAPDGYSGIQPSDIDALRERYYEVFGRKPHHRLGAESMLEAIEHELTASH